MSVDPRIEAAARELSYCDYLPSWWDQAPSEDVEADRDWYRDIARKMLAAADVVDERLTTAECGFCRVRIVTDARPDCPIHSVDALCVCGHDRRAHIYHEGPCRPGFVCAASCDSFRPRVLLEEDTPR